MRIGDFNTPISKVDRTSREQSSKDITLNNTFNQVDLMNTYRTLLPTIAENILFPSVRRTFTKIEAGSEP